VPLPVLASCEPLYRDKLIVELLGHYQGAPRPEKHIDRMLKGCPRMKRIPMKAFKHDEKDVFGLNETFELDGFLEMLLRVSDILFTSSDDSEDNVANDFDTLVQTYIMPNVHLLERSDDVHEEQLCEVGELMTKYEPQFRCLFKYFTTQGTYSEQGGQFSNASMLSVNQFLMLAKECKLSILGISFNVCLEMFVTVNQEEIERFLVGEIPYNCIADALQMEFPEFQRAYQLMMVRLYTNQVKKSKKEVDFMEFTEQATLKMFKQTPGNILKEMPNMPIN